MIRKSPWLALLAAMFLAGSALGNARDSLEARARTFAQAFFDGRFETAQVMFDDRMRTALTQDKFNEVRQSVTGQFGAFTGMLGVRFEKLNEYDVVFVTCQFAQERLDMKLVFDPRMRVSGLFFAPPPPVEGYKLPMYVRPTSFTEKTVKLNEGTDHPLEGTLSLPLGDTPCPCVVLVHGSGPNDRDETVGVIKPFSDLATGLASQGVGVLRYDKRTKVHAQQAISSPGYTVKEEVLDDVVEAVRLLGTESKCRRDRIFVLGHSLGAMLMPRIAPLTPTVAGFILLAAPNRPLEDMVLSQTEHILMLDGKLSQADSATLVEVARQVARIKSLTSSSPDFPVDSLLGARKAYWLDLQKYTPAEAAKQMTKPTLVLQGERDYQVTMADFQSWQRSLTGQANFTFTSFPQLNHLFIEGSGKSSPAEYNRSGNVAKEVVDTLARWIKAQ